MLAVDTNVLVRLVVRDDPDQTIAAERFIRAGAWVSVLAVAEATWVLASVYRVTSNDVADAVEMLLNHQQLVVQESDAVASAIELLRKRPMLGFSDCLMLELARRAGHLPLGTFDRNLGKVDGAERIR